MVIVLELDARDIYTGNITVDWIQHSQPVVIQSWDSLSNQESVIY